MTLVGAEYACRPTLDSGLASPEIEYTAGVAGVIRQAAVGPGGKFVSC